jgi:hypothetical protein
LSEEDLKILLGDAPGYSTLARNGRGARESSSSVAGVFEGEDSGDRTVVPLILEPRQEMEQLGIDEASGDFITVVLPRDYEFDFEEEEEGS